MRDLDESALRRCVRDLVALSTLSATWTNRQPSQVGDSLCEVLLRVLDADMTYVRILTRGGPREAARAYGKPCEPVRLDALLHLLDERTAWATATLPNPIGDGVISAAAMPIGIGGEWGFAVVATARLDFPQPAQKLLLGVAANHAATALQNWHTQEALAAARREADLQKTHLFSLFEQAPMPICILRGPEHVVELANPAMCRVWGRQPGDVLGLAIFDALPETRGQAFGDLLTGVLRTGVPYVGKELAVQLDRRGDGTLQDMYFNFVYAPLRNLQDEVEGVLVTAFEVTDEVHARERVDRLRAEAEVASRAKDEFMAMLGHELRNPLSPILTALHLMRLRRGSAIEKERSIIERQVAHLVRLVDDLLDVSRITTGKVVLARSHLELAEVVNQAVEMASPLLEQRRHELVVDVPAVGLSAFGDPGRLAQVVSNLLTNAAKFTPPGGRVTVSARRAEELVVVKVTDTGAGISRELLPKVFEMFVQERQGTDRSQGGLGLGLAIVRSLVEMHGGKVSVASEGQGRGTEFTVTLPFAEHHAAGAGGPAAVAAEPQARRRVLVVDDNEDAAQTLADWLAARGHVTDVAYDGPSALQRAREAQPDVVIVDIGLPVMDGYELARGLREEHGSRSLLLIALTGYAQEADKRRTEQAGFDAHLVKPVSVEQLEALLAGPAAAGASVEAPEA